MPGLASDATAQWYRRAGARATLVLATIATSLASAGPGDPALARFIEETDSAGLQSRFDGDFEFQVGGGVASFDCDGDALPEVYVTGGVGKAKFYRNRSSRGGPIKLLEERSGLELTGANGAYPIDIDGDGHVDLVVLRVGEVQLFRGLGGCRFERANDSWKFRSDNQWHSAFSATWERNQTWPTLAIGSYIDRARADFPWGNCTAGSLVRPASGDRGFAEPVPLAPGHCALSMLFSDWSGRGDVALRVSNDREYFKGGQEQLWQLAPGQAPRLYTAQEGWKPLQVWGMGIASHDLDGSGRPAVFLTSMSDNKLQVLEGDGRSPSYTDNAYKRGVTAHRPYVGGDIHPSTAWHAQFGDVNNDGYSDLFIVKGNVASMPDFATLDPNNLLLQKPDGQFVETGQQAGMASYRRGRGGLLVDLNGDGLLDMLVVNRWDKAQLWRNIGSGSADKPQSPGQWLQLRLHQSGGNRDAIGAWVEVDLGARVIRQELTIGGGHASGHLGFMHFGLGESTAVKLRVRWPHGPWSDWQNAAAGSFYLVDRATGIRPWSPP
ncbi:MAG TPA: CRTAC1 family protein [Burkholderiaceae bacterium]|nr:CRTAC1 family protein [Burkholderiaceae bacterium]